MNLQGKLRCKIIHGVKVLQLQDWVNNWLREMPVNIVSIFYSGNEKFHSVCIFYTEDNKYGTK